MTLLELKQVLDRLEVPVTFLEWKKGNVPTLPYIVYSKGSSRDTIADNYNFIERFTAFVDLYQDNKRYDFELEKRLRELFKIEKIPFSRDEVVSIEKEGMYQTSFYITIEEK